MQACDRCHSRKTRCDRRLPSCTACEKAGVACLHKDKLRQRHLPRGYVDGIENKLQSVMEENARLKRELAALRSDAGVVDRDGNPGTANIFSNEVDEEASPDSSENAVSSEVGYLSLKATGETRYVGSSSGLGLAGIMSRMVDEATGLALLPSNVRDANASEAVNTASVGEESSMPTRRAAMPFIEAYFQHTHITFPLLHRASFLEMVDRIYQDSDYYTSHTYDAFMFDMVLSIGSSNFNRFGDASAASSSHYARAQVKLPAVLGMPGLMPFRAMLILSHHGIFSNLRDTSASIWHLIGIGVRICYEMGLHLEARRQVDPSNPNMRLVSFEEEMNRRCFWCLYNLDRVVSFTLGRPVAIKDEDIDVSLPLPIDDAEFGPGIQISQDKALGRGSSPFLHLIRMRRLSGQILATFYSARHCSKLCYEDRRALRQRFHDEVVAWKDDTQTLDLANRADPVSSFTSCFLSPDWYTAVFNNAMLLLYRPSPSFPHPTNSTSQNNEEGDLLHLFSAAKGTINAYAQLHNKRRLNYSWITLHGVFIAGLAYVYCIGRALKDPSRVTPIPDYLDIINDTRACSNVLVAICERWNVVRRSCELFNRLSNAVIRDAVNAAAKEHTRQRPTGNVVSNDSGSCNTLAPLQQNMSNTAQHPSMSTFAPNTQHMATGDMSPLDHFFVADEFKHYSAALDGILTGNDEAYPSEMLIGFSQDWPFEDTFSDPSGFGVQMPQQYNIWQ